MRFDSVMIDLPERQPPIRRTVFGVLAALAWGAYSFLWLPLVTLLVWLLGVRSAYLELYLRSQPFDPFLLFVLPTIALGVAIVLIGWAEYNRRRFGRLTRRRPPADVSPDAVATALGADRNVAQTLRRARCSVLRMSEEARPVGIGIAP